MITSEKLDDQSRIIIRELIRNPRISDNQISIRTNVPLKTVNRKRKILESKHQLRYYCQYDKGEGKEGIFALRKLYLITLKEGITRKVVMEKFESAGKERPEFSENMMFNFIGENGGNMCIIFLVEAKHEQDFSEIFNGTIVREIETLFGPGSIKDSITLPIFSINRVFRNYLPKLNMAMGKLRENWPLENIFVDE